MKTMCLLAMLLCTPLGYAHAQSRDTTSDASFKAFLARWEEAQSKFINGDASLWKQLASRGDDATILGAFGGYGEKGWNAVGARYDWAASQYQPGDASIKIEYVSIVVSGDVAYTVAIERQEGARVSDQNPRQRALRATQIFRREGGDWKLLHRHADPLVKKAALTRVP